MPDREVAGRHPFHPALVHFPIACWGLSHPTDLAALAGIEILVFGLDCWAVSGLLVWAGVVTALPAMIVGIYDFMQLPDEDRLMQGILQTCRFRRDGMDPLPGERLYPAGRLPGFDTARVAPGPHLRRRVDMSLYRRVVWRTDGIQVSPGNKSRRVMTRWLHFFYQQVVTVNTFQDRNQFLRPGRADQVNGIQYLPVLEYDLQEFPFYPPRVGYVND